MARVSRHRPKSVIHATRESMMNDAIRAESGDEHQGSAESFHQRVSGSDYGLPARALMGADRSEITSRRNSTRVGPQ